MSSAIIRNGHWRRRDPLAGLSQQMLAALRALAEGSLGQTGGTDVRSLRALAERGLLRRRAGPDGLLPDYGLTPEGHAVVSEMRRRETARQALIAERADRARSVSQKCGA